MNIYEHTINRVAEDFNLTKEDILGNSRKSEVVDARCIIASIFFNMGKSLSEIGRIINRDHTTVMNLIKRKNKNDVLKNLSENYTLVFKNKIKNGFNK